MECPDDLQEEVSQIAPEEEHEAEIGPDLNSSESSFESRILEALNFTTIREDPMAFAANALYIADAESIPEDLSFEPVNSRLIDQIYYRALPLFISGAFRAACTLLESVLFDVKHPERESTDYRKW